MAIARTDVEGAFELRGVDPGMEWVHALSEGFAPASLQIEEMQEGELREELILEVMLGGSIEGHVYDRHGNPLPGRMVAGMAPDSQDFWQAATDDEGYYLAQHVKPGNYFVVTAALDDDALFTGDFLSVLGGTRLAQKAVKDGQTVTLDIEDLAAGGCKLKGQVLSGGMPIANAAMFAMATDTAGPLDFRIATARTDDNGVFDFGEMAPGEYKLQVQAASWDGSIEFFVDDIPEDYQILEAPRGEIHGRVVHELTGLPIEGASVSLVRDDGSGGGMFGMFGGGGRGGEWANTDASGEFSFDGVSPGEYHVEVTMNRWGWSSDEPDSEPLGRAKSRRFDLGENQSRRVKDVQLPVASTLSLIVTDASGDPFGESFSIEAVRSDGEGDSLSGWGWNGKGNVSGLEAGSWDVTVQSDGYATAQQANVEIGVGERVELKFSMEVGGDIHIRMEDSTGQPLMGAKITVLDSEGVRVSRQGLGAFAAFAGGEDGSFPAGTYAQGSYRVIVEWQGERQEKRVSVVSGDFRLVEFTF
jgi:protocatechuate 3,4-dioxygenase beta subunit